MVFDSRQDLRRISRLIVDGARLTLGLFAGVTSLSPTTFRSGCGHQDLDACTVCSRKRNPLGIGIDNHTVRSQGCASATYHLGESLNPPTLHFLFEHGVLPLRLSRELHTRQTPGLLAPCVIMHVEH